MPQWTRYDRDGLVGVITLDRPPLNLIDGAFLDGLLNCLEEARTDRHCRAIILESAMPGTFCAGLDLKAAIGWSESALRSILTRLYLDILDSQASLGKPTIATPAGVVRGGGITLCIQCDVIVCDAQTDFAYSEIDAGLGPGHSPFAFAKTDGPSPGLCAALHRRIVRC